MLIVCPNCATSYMIDSASVGPNGRAVRCARCKSTWFAGASKSAPGVSAFVDGAIAEAAAESGSAYPDPSATAQDDSPPPTATEQPATADDFGGEPASSTPEQITDKTRSEIAKWTKVIAEADIPKQ